MVVSTYTARLPALKRDKVICVQENTSSCVLENLVRSRKGYMKCETIESLESVLFYVYL